MKQNFAIAQPLATHFRQATCKEIECAAYVEGWQTIVPDASPQANYIRNRSERTYTERYGDNGMVEFTFPPGQMCFNSWAHRVPNGRPEIFIHESLGNRRVHTRGIDWVEHVHDEIDPVIDAIKREGAQEALQEVRHG